MDCPPTSPLVIDLDGDGIELTSLQGSKAFFDLNIDGFAEQTGWVQSDDGLLALDVNGNGRIDDNSELFGNATGFDNGFAQLSELDKNNDGVIDVNDSQFADLKVWRDYNQDGVSNDGELQGLIETGIVSVDLNAEEVFETNLEHLVSDRSSVTFSDGSNGIIEDIHFQNDTTTSVRNLPEDFEFNPESILLPVLFGYGAISNTWVALTLNDGLREQAKNLVSLLANGDTRSFIDDFESFVWDWAGVSDVEPTSRGSYIDARHLSFLEKAYGSSFVDQYGGSNPRINAGRELEEFYEDLVKKLAGRFMAQSAASNAALTSSTPEEASASFAVHPLTSLNALVMTSSESDRSLEGDLSGVLSGISSAVESGTISAANAATAVFLLQADLSASAEEFDQMIANAVQEVGLDQTSEFVLYLTYSSEQGLVVGTESSETLTTYDGASRYEGRGGDDVIVGDNSGNSVRGGTGDDTLDGGDGADTYTYSLGDGNDAISDFSYEKVKDRLIFIDVNAEDVNFSQNAGKDLVITLSNGQAVTITDHFDNAQEDMELIEFADGTVLDLAGIAAKLINDQNGNGDDLVLGSIGDDQFLGGAGNDTLSGGDGADTYTYSLGDGNDVIADYSTKNGDDLLIFTDVTVGDVTFSQNVGEDLLITLSNGEVITITDHFDNTLEDMELIEFADGTVLDGQAIRDKSVADQKASELT